MKLLIDDNIPLAPETLIGKVEFEVLPFQEITNACIKEYKADALLIRSTLQINEELLADTNVKFVATATSGSDHFDKEYLGKSQIHYEDALGCNSNSVTEFTLYSIFESYGYDFDFSKLKIGIIGFGNVGSKLAYYLNKLGIRGENLLICDPHLEKENRHYGLDFKYAHLKDLVAHSNVITNHIPLIYGGEHPTFELLNEKLLLSKVQENSVLINVSRGKISNEHALMELHDTRNCKLITDVWENEPAVNLELLNKSFIATPHIAGHTEEGKLNGTKIVLERLAEFANLDLNYNLIDTEVNKHEKKSILSFKSIRDLMQAMNEVRNLQIDSDNFKSQINTNPSNDKEIFKKFRTNYKGRREVLSPYH